MADRTANDQLARDTPASAGLTSILVEDETIQSVFIKALRIVMQEKRDENERRRLQAIEQRFQDIRKQLEE